jgi:hypothetical protein
MSAARFHRLTVAAPYDPHRIHRRRLYQALAPAIAEIEKRTPLN